MARTTDPNSATAQFFINVVDNEGLNRPKPDGHGYAVFGRVIEGMDVVDKIRSVYTQSRMLHSLTPSGQQIDQQADDVPRENVIIESVRREEDGSEAPA